MVQSMKALNEAFNKVGDGRKMMVYNLADDRL